jgi:Zn-dependent metalloprotease
MGLNKSKLISLSEEVLLEEAKRVLPAEEYIWENENAELQLKENFDDNTRTYAPNGDLVYQKINSDLPFTNNNMVLCYEYTIVRSKPYDAYKIYLSVSDGATINVIPLLTPCEPAMVTTNYYGPQTINTTYSAPNYILKDDCAEADIEVYDDFFGGTLIQIINNTSWNANDNLKSAGTSLWVCKTVQNYYLEKHSRNGWNNLSGDIDIHQNGVVYGDSSNASFLWGNMVIGNNGTFTNLDDYNPIDIVGHEFTHGVTQSSADLIYEKEPGALNESFSDIFGTAIEFWATPMNFDWTIGEDRGGIDRNLANPNIGGTVLQADTYLGYGWINTIGCSPDYAMNDLCGVHYNSGVQNFMFYLLCQGGSGFNDNFDGYNVQGIGIISATQIAYRALTVYLTPSSNFFDARHAWIFAAEDLFGSCSNEAIQTAWAWYAVGVGSAATVDNVCGIYGLFDFYNVSSESHLDISAGCTAYFGSGTHSMSASQDIIIWPGFTAMNGSDVHMYIDPCYVTMYKNNSISHFEDTNSDPPELTKENKIKIYPNPVKSTMHIDAEISGSEISVNIFDAQMKIINQMVWNKSLDESSIQIDIDVSDLASGIYFVNLASESQMLSTKFIVQK